jgi:hypothetical protein
VKSTGTDHAMRDNTQKETEMNTATASAIIELATNDEAFDDTYWWLYNLLDGARDEVEAATMIVAAASPDSGVIMFSADVTHELRSMTEASIG